MFLSITLGYASGRFLYLFLFSLSCNYEERWLFWSWLIACSANIFISLIFHIFFNLREEDSNSLLQTAEAILILIVVIKMYFWWQHHVWDDQEKASCKDKQDVH